MAEETKAIDREEEYERILKIAEYLRQRGVSENRKMDWAVHFHLRRTEPAYEGMSEQEQKERRDALVKDLDGYIKVKEERKIAEDEKKNIEAQEAIEAQLSQISMAIGNKINNTGMSYPDAREEVLEEFFKKEGIGLMEQGDWKIALDNLDKGRSGLLEDDIKTLVSSRANAVAGNRVASAEETGATKEEPATQEVQKAREDLIKNVDYEKFLSLEKDVRRSGVSRGVMDTTAQFYAESYLDGYERMSEEEQKNVRNAIISGLDPYKQQKAQDEARKKEQEVLEARKARDNLIENTDYKKVLEEIEKVSKDGKTRRGQVMDTAVGNYASSNVAGYESMSKEEQKNVRDAIIFYGIPRYRGQKGKEEADRIAQEALEAKEKHDNLLLQMQKDFGSKLATGMPYVEAKKEVLEGLFEKEKITDPKEQEAWEKEFDGLNDPTLLARTKQTLSNAAGKAYARAGGMIAGMKGAISNIGAKKEEPAAQEAPKGVDVVNPVAANPEKVEEDANQKVRDRQARRIWQAAFAMIGKGVESGKAMLEALADFFKKEKISDPKEQETLKQAVETYPKRVVEKENAAEEANKKSGRKVLQNGVVSKWLSRNKDKLLGATALGIGVVAATNAAVGGFGLMAPIMIAGVSSTVFPPFIALGAGLVACNYLKNAYAKRKAEKEAAKEKGKTNVNPLNTANKQGGR